MRFILWFSLFSYYIVLRSSDFSVTGINNVYFSAVDWIFSLIFFVGVLRCVVVFCFVLRRRSAVQFLGICSFYNVHVCFVFRLRLCFFCLFIMIFFFFCILVTDATSQGWKIKVKQLWLGKIRYKEKKLNNKLTWSSWY